MCLIVKGMSHPKVAKKDIICYKILKTYNGHDFLSPYQDAYSPLNELIYVTSFQIKRLTESVFFGIHTYKKKEVLKQLLLKYNRLFMDVRFEGVEAIIPKGSLYWEGMFNEQDSYCSNQIIYRKIEDEL